MAALPERSLDRYELVERVAVGGMAEVYLAKAYGAHGFEKTLAIKRILPELARDREFENRFISEAKLAVSLSHANIVQVMDFGRFGESLFIAMEFVRGLDLAQMLKRYRTKGERIALPAAFQIAVEIMRGLDFAHQHGVVHRDVSPSNILLSRAGEVKIADFGIAMAARPALARPAKRRRIMGKWRYMSPEQTRGEDLGTASDLFSAATVLYELFTGSKLFPGDEAETIIENIHEMEIPPASSVRDTLPARLDEILAAALARDPAERPARAAEMQRALTEISYESSIVATALDVSEAVHAVLGEADEVTISRTPPGGIDDLIRQQLGSGSPDAPDVDDAQKTAGRRTAVATEVDGDEISATTGTRNERETEPITKVEEDDVLGDGAVDHGPGGTRPATIVKTGVDPDGVTVWEVDEDTIAAVPSAIRLGKRTGSVSAIPPDTGTAARRASPLVWMLAVAAAVGLGAAAVAVFGGNGEQPRPRAGIAVTPPGDAGPESRPATLYVDSTPRGADVFVDGEPVGGVTPVTLDVAPGVPHTVHVELDGFDTFTDEGIVVAAGETTRIRPRLIANRAALSVASDPPGATVRARGHDLGTTPLELDGLEPGRRVLVTILLDGYTPRKERVDLVAGETAALDVALAKAQATPPPTSTGKVHIYMEQGWADVYLDGRKIGRATTRQPLTLPAGKHRLRLHNPVSGAESHLPVEVVAGERRNYRATL